MDLEGAVVGTEGFGASGPCREVLKGFEFTRENEAIKACGVQGVDVGTDLGRQLVFGYLLRVKVRPGMIDEMVEFVRWDANVARDSEPGTLRFDVWRSATEQDILYLCELYQDEAAFEFHKQQEPFKKFAATIKNKCIEDDGIELLALGDSVVASNAISS